MDYTAILDEILDSHHYLALGTASEEAHPWVAPICYVRGERKEFFFISHRESVHTRNIEKNPQVSFAIYNSGQIVGNAFGVQGSGTAKKIESENVPYEAQKRLFQIVSEIVLTREYAFYRIDIDTIYLPDSERWKKGSPIRTPINL